MPRLRNLHWTDGPGIGKKLKGQELIVRLEELADTAECHHNAAECRRIAAETEWCGWASHARQAGDALLEAKRRLGHRLNWSKWRRRNLITHGIMSKETSCIYMQVARNWDDDRLVEARKRGIKIDSIRSVLRVLSGETSLEPDPRDERPDETEEEHWDRIERYDASPTGRERRRQERVDEMRKQTRREFANKLRELDDFELRILSESFVPYLWNNLYADVRNGTCVIYGDHYGEGDEADRDVIEKIKRALNSSKRRRAKAR